MEERDKRLIEKLEADFHKLSSQEGWTKEDLEKMKDLQKLMYYMEVRCAMKKGQGYPGSDYMDDYGHTSYAMSQTQRFPMGYQGYNMSGRRYYDDERSNAIGYLQRMHSNEQNPEMRMALERAIRELEMR